MTQLFDTSTYAIDTAATDPGTTSDLADADSAGGPRHLQSVPAPNTGSEPAWRLDAETIETGRRGIARARQALQETRQADSARRSAA